MSHVSQPPFVHPDRGGLHRAGESLDSGAARERLAALVRASAESEAGA